jgi:hypothetical protein
MDHFDIEKFRMPGVVTNTTPKKEGLPAPRVSGYFLTGPIPWEWWSTAARLPGKTLEVASVIWLIARLGKSRTLQLQRKFLDDMRVSRQATNRILKSFEKAELISCERLPGRRAKITILDSSAEKTNGTGNESGLPGGSEF